MPDVWQHVYEQIAYSFIDMLKWLVPAIVAMIIIVELIRMGQDKLVDIIIENVPEKARKPFAILMLIGILLICIGIFYGFDLEIVYK